MRIAVALLLAAVVAAVTGGGKEGQEPNADEQIVRAAGLGSDDAALLGFFNDRVRMQGDGEKLLALARKLGDPNPKTRSKLAAQLISVGPAAIPALHHVVNDLDDAVAAEEALRCLDWLEGKRRGEIATAAARLLAARKSVGAAEALMAFLPFADDGIVIDGLKAALFH